MKQAAIVITLVIGLTAGTAYTWMNTPGEIFIWGIHAYFVLAFTAFLAAFISAMLFRMAAEQIILLSTGGFLAAVLFNSLAFNLSLPHTLNDELFIVLFFAGHAALMGAFGAKAVKTLRPQHSRWLYKEHSRRPSRYNDYMVTSYDGLKKHS